MADCDFDNPTFDRDDVDVHSTIYDNDNETVDPVNNVNPEDEIWEVPNELPTWADSGVPSGVFQEDLANRYETEALVDR